MARYSDGVTEAEVGDIVKCVVAESPIDARCDLDGDCTYRVERVAQEHIHVSGKVVYSNRFELIKRTGAAPAPEPDQPAVKNGTYALGETPEVGDLVECVESHGNHLRDLRYVVQRFNGYGNLVSESSGHGSAPCRFKLISRKQEQPMSEPLVKWPEEPKAFDFLHVPKKSLFVARRYPQTVLYKDNEGNFHVIAGEVVAGLNHTEYCRLVRVTDGVAAFTVI